MTEFRKFIASKPFIYCVAAFCFLMWYFKFELIGFVILIGFVCFVLVTQKELTPVLPIVILAITGVTLTQLPLDFLNDPRYVSNVPFALGMSVVVTLIVGLIACCIIHFIRFKHEKSEDKSPIIIPFFVAVLSMMMGGLFSKEPYYALSLGMVAYFLFVIVIFILVRLVNPEGDKLKYFATVAIALGLVVSAQITIFYLRTENVVDAFTYKHLNLFWGTHNFLGTLLPPAMFMSVYMFTRTQRTVYLIFAHIFLLATIFTVSRGTIFLTVLTLPVLIFLKIKYAKRKWQPLAVMVFFMIAIYLSYVVFKDECKQILDRISYFDNSGRTPIRIMYQKLFAQNPFFGVGFFITSEADTLKLISPHMIFIEILSSCGIVGFFAFSWFFYESFKVVFTQKSRYNLFMLLVFFVYFGYGLADPTLFRLPTHFVLLVLLQGSRRELDSEGRLKAFVKLDNALYKTDTRIIITLAVSIVFAILTFLIFGLSGYEKFLFGKETCSYIFGSGFAFLTIATVPPALKRFVNMRTKKL